MHSSRTSDALRLVRFITTQEGSACLISSIPPGYVCRVTGGRGQRRLAGRLLNSEKPSPASDASNTRSMRGFLPKDAQHSAHESGVVHQQDSETGILHGRAPLSRLGCRIATLHFRQEPSDLSVSGQSGFGSLASPTMRTSAKPPWNSWRCLR